MLQSGIARDKCQWTSLNAVGQWTKIHHCCLAVPVGFEIWGLANQKLERGQKFSSQTGKNLLVMIFCQHWCVWIYNSDLNAKEIALHSNILVVFMWPFTGPGRPKGRYLLLLLTGSKAKHGLLLLKDKTWFLGQNACTYI